MKGACNVLNSNTVEITELPVGKWIRDYKNFLEDKMETTKEKDAEIEDVKEYHAGNRVHFVVKTTDKQMEKVRTHHCREIA